MLDETGVSGDVDLAFDQDVGLDGRELDFEDYTGLFEFLENIFVVVNKGDWMIVVVDVELRNAFDEWIQVVEHHPFG